MDPFLDFKIINLRTKYGNSGKNCIGKRTSKEKIFKVIQFCGTRPGGGRDTGDMIKNACKGKYATSAWLPQMNRSI